MIQHARYDRAASFAYIADKSYSICAVVVCNAQLLLMNNNVA